LLTSSSASSAYLGRNGIDLAERDPSKKMLYNETRPHKHGGKAL
jgi:hypothetical protein